MNAYGMTTLVVLVSVLYLSAPAQTTQSNLPYGRAGGSAAAYYYLAKPDELTMVVNVWGFVQKPGVYEVPSSTDLVQLISYAGGPAPHAKLSSVKIVRLARENPHERKKQELKVNLQHLHRIDDESLVVYPGDTVVIESTSWRTFREVLTVVGATAAVAASMALTIEYLSR